MSNCCHNCNTSIQRHRQQQQRVTLTSFAVPSLGNTCSGRTKTNPNLKPNPIPNANANLMTTHLPSSSTSYSWKLLLLLLLVPLLVSCTWGCAFVCALQSHKILIADLQDCTSNDSNNTRGSRVAHFSAENLFFSFFFWCSCTSNAGNTNTNSNGNSNGNISISISKSPSKRDSESQLQLRLWFRSRFQFQFWSVKFNKLAASTICSNFLSLCVCVRVFVYGSKMICAHFC